jgi:RNA polymerase sigma factor (TIGR02999 family)
MPLSCPLNKLTSVNKADIVSIQRTRVRCGVVVPGTASQSVSDLLAQSQAGDEESLRRLIPLVCNELRRVAHNRLRRESPDHTLQTTALVHGAYVCLVKQAPMDFENWAHFFGVCANLMREVLVQYARRRKAVKRDAGYKLTLGDAIALPQNQEDGSCGPG